MWHHHLERVMDGLSLRRAARRTPTDAHETVLIRAASDADLPLVHDLAELDSAEPLAGPVLVAVVDGRPRAALALDGGRVVADPFFHTEAAVGLLRLRARQLRDAARVSPAPVSPRLTGVGRGARRTRA